MPRPEPSVDALFAQAMRAGESLSRVRAFLQEADPEESLLLGLLRRPVPVRLLEHLAVSAPWSDRPRIIGGIVLNPRTPRALAQRLLPAVLWRNLADVAASPRLHGSVRVRAEAILKEKLADLRLGERITLAKIATPALLAPLLADTEPKVASAALINPRLREEDLVFALRQDQVSKSLLEEIAASVRWRESYAVRLALVLQGRTPLGIALAQISSLVKRDLLRVASAQGIAPLVQAAALRVAGSTETGKR